MIAELADRQHGVVARRQLLLFAPTDAISGRIQRGILHPIHRGVYAVGRPTLPIAGRWMAATLAVGSGATLSHRSAAQLWGLRPRSPSPPEVTIPSGWRGQPGIWVHRSALPEDEVSVLDGIPVTTVPRTLLDLAAAIPRRQLELALNEAEVRRLADRLSLPDLLRRYPRRHGTAVLRAILGEENALSGVTKNDFEERFASLLDAHGLPRPRFNADLVVRGRHFNVDCLWSEERLIVELDGGAVHRTARAFEADRERDRILGAEGWQVVRVTWRQLTNDAEGVVDDVRRSLRRRAAHPPTL